MKRLLNYITVCFSLLVLFAQASWAADSYTASYKLAVGETHTAGDKVSVYGTGTTDLAATLTFGFTGEVSYLEAKSYSGVDGFTAYTPGNGVNGKADGLSGTAYIINPVYNGTVTVGVYLNAGKKFYILEEGTALADYNGITVDSKYCGTYSFNVTAGKTYTVTAAGTKLGFFGFTYTYSTEGGGDSGGGDEPVVQTYALTFGVSPANAGYTSPSNAQQLEAGRNVAARAYSNSSDFTFKNWTANGEVVSEVNSFTYTMPAEDVNLVANFEYNPANPADPNAKLKHTLNLISEPANAGSFDRTSGTQYEEGKKLSIYAYANSGYVFDKWMSADTLITTNRSFTLTMPDHDVELKAVYHFDPSNPENPDTAVIQYNVVLDTQPANAGYFNWNKETGVVANRWCNIYAYPNPGYVFREWQKDGETVSSEQRYRFQMPAEHIRLVAVYDYNPTNPENPNKNYWNEATGEVIVDDFTPGDLYSAVYNAIGGSSNNNKVQMITVAGPVSQYDWGVVNNYPNCTFLDMSRTHGMTSVPSYNFNGNSVLTTVALPAGIETIEYYAFRNCSNLSSISCYALTPPTIGSRAFEGIGDSIVYVPAEAIALYQEAAGWKDFTILPLSGQVSALEVNMPEGTDPAVYKDMYIELINTKSGQKLRYVVTNRTTYTFNSLIHRTSYNVYLKNAQGDVLGEIDAIDIVDHDVSVTFESLMVPRDLTLTVQTPAGQDVTDQTVITWMDKKDTYLTKGKTLTGQMEGALAKFRITLPQSLAMQYLLPEDSLYTVQEVNNISYTLEAIPQMTIGGKVMDVKTGKAINGATVAISQMLNGLYSKTFTTKTNAQGEWQQTVYKEKTDITASMTDYVSQTLTLEALTEEVPTFELKDINGTAITLNLTYTPVGGETQAFYSDYANVSYTVFNNTTKQQITQMNVQYPQIVLMESLPEGTELTVTATSKNQKFMPVAATAAVDDKDAAMVTLPIVQLGGISASFTQTDNNSVVGILYNGSDRLVKKYDYNGATLTIDELNDGEYTLVTMANSQFFNSVATLSQFGGAGLREGVDYIKNKVTVQSGAYTAIKNSMVPFLDETKLYYTGDNTSVSVNKSQITVGNYLTLTGKLDFKSAYAGNVSNVKLIVDLPQESSFVDNSVMVGSSVSGYTYEGHTVTIPMNNYSERARFCFIPTAGGTYTATASVQFTMNGKEMTQPIGNVNFSAKDLSISVPSTVAKTTVPVSGTAVGRSAVSIFADGTLVGQTTALANGSWATTIDLGDPYNMSSHDIYAKLMTPQGVEMQSETQSVLYDMSAVEVKTVTMSFYNGWLRKTIDVVYDFQKGTTSESSYMFYTGTDVTFVADLTNNDTTVVSDVVIHVLTDRDEVRSLSASYDKKTDRWVAVSRFESNNLPVNINVDFNAAVQSKYDLREISDLRDEITQLLTDYANETAIANSINEEMDSSEYAALLLDLGYDAISEINGDSIDAVLAGLSDEELTAYFNNEYSSFQELDAESQQQLQQLSSWLAFNNESEFVAEDGSKYTMTTCDGLVEDNLENEGYEKIECTDGSFIYIKLDGINTDYIDFVHNLHVTITGAETNAARGPLKANDSNFVSEVANALKKINDVIDQINKWSDKLVDKTQAGEKLITRAIEEIEFRLAKADKYIGYASQKGMSGEVVKWKLEKLLLQKNLLQAKAALKIARGVFKRALKALPVIKYVAIAADLGNKINKIQGLYFSIPDPCPNDEAGATACKASCFSLLGAVTALATVDLIGSFTSDAEIVAGVVGSVASAGVSLTATVWGFVQKALAALGKIVLDSSVDWAMDNLSYDIRHLKCKGTEPNDDEPRPRPSWWPFKPVQPIHDPSGYVYEGVSSNRLPGVTATAYYKETVEDMYGDLHENIVLWDAEEYAQQNPLFTDEYGMYQWDVPQGLWQVKFEKEGYQTTYSEWLPVPPPQLEVNIAMTQLLQPAVVSGQAFSNGVEFSFDKYMDPATLTIDNIVVTKNGNVVAGEIKLLNEEKAYEDQEQTYASKVRFEVPEGEELLVTDAVQLTVRKAVKSYAGIQMEADYVQAFDVELQVRKVAVDELINVAYGGTRTLTIAAQPGDAAKGKTMKIKSLSTMIATANLESVTLDENGQAEIVVTGELPGSTVLNFAVEGTDVEGQMTVNVKDAANLMAMAPRASRVSGTEVYRGAKIQLTSETENAVIYYTLDGTCPCDLSSPSVMRYDPNEPIVIADDNVTIKAMATGTDLAESEVMEFHYVLKKTALGYQMPAGWTWISHNVETAVPVSEFEEHAERILSQTAETVKDPQWGFFGNLNELQPAVGYKVKVNEYTDKRLDGVEFNAIENTVGVISGWNWIGYPLNQVMTVDEALTYFSATSGDYIVGQDGFAEYDGSQWQGTLEGLRPGQGYLFKSATATDIHFNTNFVSNAVNSVGKRNWLIDSPWAFDSHAYSNAMPVTAELFADGFKASDGDYIVGAFVEDECRGVGQWRDGRIMMNVYGEADETVHFVAFDTDDDRYYDIMENVSFTADNQGSWFLPMTLTMGGETTGMKALYDEVAIRTSLNGDYLSVNIGGKLIDRLTITNTAGVNMLSVSNLGTGATITTGQLPSGVYIITVRAEGHTYYKKIVKANR